MFSKKYGSRSFFKFWVSRLRSFDNILNKDKRANLWAGQIKKKWKLVFDPELQNGQVGNWMKLYLYLWETCGLNSILKWASHSPVLPLVDLTYGFEAGFVKRRLNMDTDKEFWTFSGSLFHSLVVEGKYKFWEIDNLANLGTNMWLFNMWLFRRLYGPGWWWWIRLYK